MSTSFDRGRMIGRSVMCNSSCWVPDAGRTEYWEVFQDAYRAVMQHYRSGAWYDDADIVTGRTLHQQFQSLQAFWPGACLPAPLLLFKD